MHVHINQQLPRCVDRIFLPGRCQALAHLPYFIALDHDTRTVVVAVRGTYSMEDVITDAIAEPLELPRDWLPPELAKVLGYLAMKCTVARPLMSAMAERYEERHLQAVDQGGQRFYAHAGIVAAAAAVFADLDKQGILHALLNNDYSRVPEVCFSWS